MVDTCVFRLFSYFSICLKYFIKTKISIAKNIFSEFSFFIKKMSKVCIVFMLYSIYCVVLGSMVKMPL